MKKSFLLAASLLAFNLTPVFGQQPTTTTAPIFPPQVQPPSAPDFQQQQQQQRFKEIINSANSPQYQAQALTKFDLDFPGGTPKELVAAIEKATGKPLNAIIPTEDADLQMPPLKMDDVDVARLFRALEYASVKQVAVGTSSSSYSIYNLSYGFKTDGQLTDNSVWYFHVEKPTLPPVVSTEKICQFYSLAPYLDRGFTVDDITTAIQTGWKMAGVTPAPELNYHKETRLLIAFGEPNQLQTIQQVLQTLPSVNQEFWRQANNNIRELQQQVDQLKKQLPAPVSSPSTTLELKTGQ